MEIGTVREKIVCSGAIFYAKSTGKILLLQKKSGRHAGTWGIVGGTNDLGENAWQGLQREISEEIGQLPNVIKTVPLETFVSNDHVFNFHTYLCVIQEEFIPKLSEEHAGWCWCNIDTAPKPLHQGLRSSFGNKTVRAKLQTIFDVMALL